MVHAALAAWAIPHDSLIFFAAELNPSEHHVNLIDALEPIYNTS